TSSFSLMPPPPPRSTLFPYTTLFRSRKWRLHVWKLTGPANTWEAQLQEHLAAEPVFAVLSGIGGKNWAPVHHFCEQAELPCLFRSEEHTSELQSRFDLVCRLLLEKKK